MPVCHRCTSAASPAKLIFAQPACHVVAALVLLNNRFAEGAPGYLTRVGLGPLTKLLAESCVAGDVLAMPNISALEADFCAALWADDF